MNLLYYWRKIDGTLLLSLLALALMGILIIGSATHANMEDFAGRFDFVARQGIFFLIGLVGTALFQNWITASCIGGRGRCTCSIWACWRRCAFSVQAPLARSGGYSWGRSPCSRRNLPK